MRVSSTHADTKRNSVSYTYLEGPHKPGEVVGYMTTQDQEVTQEVTPIRRAYTVGASRRRRRTHADTESPSFTYTYLEGPHAPGEVVGYKTDHRDHVQTRIRRAYAAAPRPGSIVGTLHDGKGGTTQVRRAYPGKRRRQDTDKSRKRHRAGSLENEKE